MKKIHPYILGILWGIGYYYPTDQYLVVRHRDPYFPLAVKMYFGIESNVFLNGKNYGLKLHKSFFDIESLLQYGWTERNAKERPYPSIDNHKDFIRGYFEVHGSVSEKKSRNLITGQRQIQKRLHIYGNETLLQGINESIEFELGIPKRRLQKTQSEHSKLLGYYKLVDIETIFDWMYQSEIENFYFELWEKYERVIR